MVDIHINKTTLTFNNVIYASANTGNDTTGNGSKNKPFATFEKAYSIAQSGDAVFLALGVYKPAYVEFYSGRWSAMNLNKPGVSIIGESGRTIITEDEAPPATYYNPFININTPNDPVKVYGLTFIFTTYNKFFSSVADGVGYDLTRRAEFYNCVFDVNTPRIIYENGATTEFNNCVFKIDYKLIYKNQGMCNFINCCYTPSGDFTYSYGSEGHTETTCLSGVILNADYSILGSAWKHVGTGINPDGTVANIGVYGGDFAWGNWIGSRYLLRDGVNIRDLSNLEIIRTGLPSQVDFETYGVDQLPLFKESDATKPLNTFRDEAWTGEGNLYRSKVSRIFRKVTNIAG